MNSQNNKPVINGLQGLWRWLSEPLFVWVVASISGVTLEYVAQLSDDLTEIMKKEPPQLLWVGAAWIFLLILWLFLTIFIERSARKTDGKLHSRRIVFGGALFFYAILSGLVVKVTHIWLAPESILSLELFIMFGVGVLALYTAGWAAEPILNYIRHLREEDVVKTDGANVVSTFTLEHPLPPDFAPDYIIMSTSDSKDLDAEKHILEGVQNYTPEKVGPEAIDALLEDLLTSQHLLMGESISDEGFKNRVKKHPLYHLIYEAGVLFCGSAPPHIYVLVSEQTTEKWDDLEKFLRKILCVCFEGDEKAALSMTPVNIYQYESIFEAVEKGIKDAKKKPYERICVELTRGTKMYSIAAAIAASSQGVPTAYLTTEGLDGGDEFALIYRHLKTDT